MFQTTNQCKEQNVILAKHGIKSSSEPPQRTSIITRNKNTGASNSFMISSTTRAENISAAEGLQRRRLKSWSIGIPGSAAGKNCQTQSFDHI